MPPTHRPLVWTLTLGLLTSLGVAHALLARDAARQDGVDAPRFEVDPLWPRPLPNHWVLGQAIGVWVDDRDLVWIINRGSATLANNERALELKAGDCCAGAPPVLAFNAAGDLEHHWGGPGPGYDWPASNHGIFVDHLGNVWIGGNGAGDSHIVKFTRDGRFLQQFGHPGARERGTSADGQPTYAGESTDRVSFGRVAKVTVDPRTNEAYLADGYLNKRVAVIDGATGAMKRYWGAYGNEPDDADLGPYDPDAPPARQFRTPVHCADLSNDGLLYVCDRVNNRLQVFKPDGTFVREALLAPRTRASGAVWDVAFSSDEAQKYLYVADGINNRIYVLERATLELPTSFGTGGRQPGQFYGVHSIAVDSKGNIYTTETWEGKRLQKFVFKGVGRVTTDQGVVWPRPPE